MTGADVERGIELFNRKSVDRALREWTAEEVRAPAKHRLSRGDGAAAVEELKRLSGRALVVFSGAKVAFLATERDLGVILEIFSFSGIPDDEAP